MADDHGLQAFDEAGLEQLDAVNPVDVRVAAMNLLARREHSRRELKQKLSRRFKNDEVVEAELAILAAENLQSDERFAESFIRQRISRGHGPMRIRQEARQKGLSDDELECALEQEQPDWFELAEAVYRRKFGEVPPADVKERARRSRFMQYRGFSVEHFSALE